MYTGTIVFNLKTTCFFFFRSKRLTILVMLALQVLQSDDRMNPHQDHTTNTAMKKWSESLKWTSEKVNKQKLLGAMAIFNYILLPLVIVVFSCGIFTVSSMQIDLIPTLTSPLFFEFRHVHLYYWGTKDFQRRQLCCITAVVFRDEECQI